MPGGVTMGHNDSEDMNKDVQFVSEQQAIEVHTLYTLILNIYSPLKKQLSSKQFCNLVVVVAGYL